MRKEERMRSEESHLENPDVEALDCLYLSKKWPSLWGQLLIWERRLAWCERQNGGDWETTRKIYRSYVKQAVDLCSRWQRRSEKKPYMRGAATIH